MDDLEDIIFLTMVVQMGYFAYKVLRKKQLQESKIVRRKDAPNHSVKRLKEDTPNNHKIHDIPNNYKIKRKVINVKRYKKPEKNNGAQRKQIRKYWVHPSCRERSTEGFFEKNFESLKKNEKLFFDSTRMALRQFELLVEMSKEHLETFSSREGINTECRIFLTLVYLSKGGSLKSLADSFHMGLSTVRKIILEVSQVLWKVLTPVYMVELSKFDWKEISQKYSNIYNMPHCVGSIDGKIIQVTRPGGRAVKKYADPKGFDSVVLLGICDTNYIFTAVDIVTGSNDNDCIVFQDSSCGNKIYGEDVNLPHAENLLHSDNILPYYFIASSAFPLHTNLMIPYSEDSLDIAEQVFNSKLAKARSTVENTFGVLSARWKVLTERIAFEPLNAEKIINACVILHNFLKVTGTLYNCNLYCPKNYCDAYDENEERVDGIWRQDQSLPSVRSCSTYYSSNGGDEERQILTDYLFNIYNN